MRAITVIPFRKNSIGLPNKTFGLLGGMTLLERTLRQAIDWLPYPVVLYTDYTAEDIEQAGCYLGGTPTLVHDDEAEHGATFRTLDHVLQRVHGHLTASGASYDAIALMTPNTPVREKAWLHRACESFQGVFPGARSAFIVEPTVKQYWLFGTEVDEGQEETPSTLWVRGTSGTYGLRQTKVPEAYIEHTGTFLLTHRSNLGEGSRIGYPVLPIPVRHPWVGLDIHTQEDLDLANYLYERGLIPR